MGLPGSALPNGSVTDRYLRELARTRRNPPCHNQVVRSRLLPVLGIFFGGLVYGVMPRGAFGADDVAIRAAVTGAAAGMAGLVFLTLRKRSSRSR